MSQRRFLPLMLIIIAVLVVACGSDDSNEEAVQIEPVTSNDEWTPVIEEFDGVPMVQVPPGCFQMGSELGRRDEVPVQEVCFDDPFWIDQFEVSNAQYGSPGNNQGENHPRENLLWTEARDYCAARGGRLPTEAEWEYAARGPDGLMYPWGDELIEDYLVFDRNSPSQTAAVGGRPEGASWVGAQDMSGNVFEWVSSQYERYPYDAADGREDLQNLEVDRVYRGGINSYQDYAAGATFRFSFPPDRRDWFIGFRCARDT